MTLSRRLWAVALALWVAIVYVGTSTGKLGSGQAAVGFLLLGLVSVARNADPARGWPRPVALLASAAFIGLCGLLMYLRWTSYDWKYLGMLALMMGTYLALVALALARQRQLAARR